MQRTFCRLVRLILICSSTSLVDATVITTLNNTDPAPLYSSDFPFQYLYDAERDFLNRDTKILEQNGFSFEITPYFDKANSGWNKQRKKCPGPTPTPVSNTSSSGSTSPTPTGPTPEPYNPCGLGDISGRWNVLALLPYGTYDQDADPLNFIAHCPPGNAASVYPIGTTPTNTDVVCTDLPSGPYQIPQQLTNIAFNVLACIDSVTPVGDTRFKTVQSLLELQDEAETFGFLSTKLKFRKRGVRFRGAGMLTKGFGVSVQTGISHIVQSVAFMDPTAPMPNPYYALPTSASSGSGAVPVPPYLNNYDYTIAGAINPFANSLNNNTGENEEEITDQVWQGIVSCLHTNLMLEFFPTIAQAIGLKIADYEATSIDDLRGELFWRYIIELNKDHNEQYPDCAIMPYFAAGYTAGIAKEREIDNPISVPFGNNGHNAGDFVTGLSFLFYESVEVGIEGGGTFFMKRQINNFRVPNNPYQNIIYPYKTDVEVRPGATWHCGAYMNARHFDSNFSLHAQYLYINHDTDKYKILKTPTAYTSFAGQSAALLQQQNTALNQAFRVQQLEDDSSWSVQMLNLGLLYDISDGCSLGIKGQLPFGGRNVYNTRTITFSVEFVH